MNRRTIILILGLALLAAPLAMAQNFQDNEFQRQGRLYEAQAKTALDEGDYDRATELARLAQDEYRKSHEFATLQTQRFRATNAMNLAQRSIEEVERQPARARAYSMDLDQARALLAEARQAFQNEDWDTSRDRGLESWELSKATLAKDVPSDLRVGVSTGEEAHESTEALELPQFYVVVARTRNHDSFWNIAKMKEVYGDGRLWPMLWKANKSRMRNPDNPDLIYPGMVVEIPPLKKEKRSGTFKPGEVYQDLPQ